MKIMRFLPFIFFSSMIYGQLKQPRISTDFAGGNIFIERITPDTIWLRPDLRDTNGEWFYWYFKVSGIKGKTLTFRFTRDNVFTSFGPAYSINHNNAWKWLGGESVIENSFTFAFQESDTIAFFCTAFPYTQINFHEFIGRLKSDSGVILDTLCRTRKHRFVEELWISPEKEVQNKVLITARHHACEMMASYVLEGLVETVLEDPGLIDLRASTQFRIIPFVDKDGVEEGDQGKNRIPRDHNRDYNKSSIYATTSALRDKIPEWSEGKLKIALDLHCPWISGDYNEWIYLVGSSNPENEREQIVFSKLIEKHSKGALRFYHSDFLPFGEAWNKSENYDQGMSFTGWAQSMEGNKLSTTLEFPYANVLGAQVSRDNAREFGKTIAYAIRDYLTN